MVDFQSAYDSSPKRLTSCSSELKRVTNDQTMEGRPHIGQSLFSLAELKRIEIVTICEGRVQTGWELVRRIAALSAGLRVLGLQTGERVAIAALNSEWYLEWLLAVPCAAGIIAPLNHRWSVEEASEAIRQIDARIVVLDTQCLGWCTALKTSCPSLAWIVYVGGCGVPETKISCTTGTPKGVSLSHNGLIAQSLAKISILGYSKKDIYLHTATMCHIGGISSALAAVMANSCHIILPKFEPAAVFGSINKHRVSTMIVVPTMINDMISYLSKSSCKDIVHAQDTRSRSRSSVATILNGAGSLSSSQLESIQCIFPASRIFSAYGMTEACSSMTFLLVHDPEPASEKGNILKDAIGTRLPMGSKRWQNFHLGGVCVGKPPPHVEIRICPNRYKNITVNCTAANDSESVIKSLLQRSTAVTLRGKITRDGSCPSEELFIPGNILTRGIHVMNGYWGQSRQTGETMLVDGWLDTGDVGWIDEMGQLWLLGRLKDVIKTGGENVYASEVEAVLMKHPAILTAAVVGVPDIRLGEMIVAVVKIRQEWTSEYGEITNMEFQGRLLTGNLLKTHCQQHGLSRYKIPRFIVMHEGPFPMTPTGKIKRDKLRSFVISELCLPTSRLLDSWDHFPLENGDKQVKSKL